ATQQHNAPTVRRMTSPPLSNAKEQCQVQPVAYNGRFENHVLQIRDGRGNSATAVPFFRNIIELP
ncbi:MAG: hypothetical protein WAU57_22610, partial [Xanthobacteraceae bacterium]